MAIVDISLLKQHVRADDFSDDDEYLQKALDAAEDYIVVATNRSLEELLEVGGGTIPPRLQWAILMLAGHWYDNRTPVSAMQMKDVPYTLESIIKQFRKLA